MTSWLAIIRNELQKTLRKRRFLVVLLILLVLIPVFTYAHEKAAQAAEQQLGTRDWHVLLQQQIVDEENRLGSSRLTGNYRSYIQQEIAQQQYYLNHNVNPAAPGAPTFMRQFADEVISLFLPMLVVVVAVDVVSGELAEGTIKMLLTKPLWRWRILLAKYGAVVCATSLVVAAAAVFAGAISGIAFGYEGWGLPVFVGLSPDTATSGASVLSLPQWKELIMAYGFTWYVALCVATMAFFVSVVIRSSAAGMGIMMAALISGNLLAQLASSWPSIKYVAFVNLGLTDYLNGTSPPVSGMTLPFSLTVLASWSVICLLAAFVWFTQRDVAA